MSEDHVADGGLTINQTWAVAWLLGLVAVGSLVRLLKYAADGVPLQTEMLVWVLVGTIAAAFSVCCALLAGIKAAEQRLSQRLGRSAT